MENINMQRSALGYTDLAALAHVENAPPPIQRMGNWMQTYTGRQYWPIDPRPEDVVIEDIAHSLGLQCRYAGHCKRFYSVAEHSVHVARWLASQGASLRVIWQGLMHDAPEAYLVDVPRPTKPYLTGYKQIEEANWRTICVRFGLEPALADIVHEADNRILNDERVQNMSPTPKPWGYSGEPLGITLAFWSPEEAEAMFLNSFYDLIATRITR